MNWLLNLFRRRPVIVHPPVVFLDVDILSKEDIAAVKQRMTPIFVEFSGHRTKRINVDVQHAVVISPEVAT